MTQIVESISESAARWVMRADAGPLSHEEKQEVESWLAADPRHKGEYVRARAQWINLDRLAALRGQGNQYSGRRSEGQVKNSSTPLLSRRRILAGGIAAAIMMGVGVSWKLTSADEERFISGIGEVRRIPLDDGSTVLLNTDTEIVVQLGKHSRNIQLIRGEALFEVAHDKARPFYVSAVDSAVRAVGTAFVVQIEATHIDITVTEGVVEVSPKADRLGLADRSSASKVKANERAMIAFGRSPEIAPISAEEISRHLAWREGMVAFDGETLQAAVDEINRHNLHKIYIDDPALADRPVIGIFRASDRDGFSAAAATALKARAVLDGDSILLEPIVNQN